ncbi:MAG: diguanylate cyclase/phosphodiesterase (GGDEF & EAL domains) with PAS/PAC sensor(s) [uncultured Rubrobacteraceae bacterium]|uniref:Diguanylate cyclase/phosphodiesterase (GGDEF & EAL domains) with PAS/PAC sensor(S) n=1 Tax=uncultured Rubrobacteraceae bacterium TaxID=349277 RepID=A0A6J4R2N2_9ACTN|nr:MAG: diguanylate cyclase/phosphodiesterase (GGDEF & EAL domains) with PAS/PAC sensor(s) [uncultured Rubrobacteraceae bacterium]
MNTLLGIKSHDPDLRRKGRVLAVMLLGMAASVIIVGVFNVLQGTSRYDVVNLLFLLLLSALYFLNRFGFVSVAGLCTVVLTAAGSFLLIDEGLEATFITLPLPILVASSLLASWAGFAVAAAMIGIAVALGINSLSLLILAIVAVISYLFADSSDRAYRASHYRAMHDPLTDLPNRALFVDRLGQALGRAGRERKRVALLFMDLDNFKVVNDSLGHELGDELLVQAGQRIRGCLRPGDTAARLGGDEFTVLLEDVAEAGDAVHAAERILGELGAPFHLGGHKIGVSASIGIALGGLAQGRPDDLLRDADVAMYRAKREKGSYKVFQAGMHAWALGRLKLEEDLRRAVERGEFRIHFQPKVRLSTGKIAEMEALVRWGSSERGLVTPSGFIQVAEETGLIVPIGKWVLEEACRQARQWRERQASPPALRMCVNLSVRQLRGTDLIADVTQALRKADLEACCLQLEVTESMIMEDEQHTIEMLRSVADLGVQVAIDDFGKGYSSLNYLKELPANALKIDKSFVDGIAISDADTAIVRLIVELAHTLGMVVTAEGVETAAQLTRLRELGCDLGQGFYFSPPLHKMAAGALVESDPSW